MPSCDKLHGIALIRYLQDKIQQECGENGSVRCALESLEEAKVRIEELSAVQIERELFGA